MNKSQKEVFVGDLKENFLKMKAAFLADFKGISVESITTFRNELRKEKLKYKVIKNTLAKRACKDTPAACLDKHFKGQVGMAYSFDDPVSLAKILKKFADKEKNFKINIGFLEGKIVSADQVEAISNMPSKEVLIGQLVGLFASPLKGLVTVLSGTQRNFLNVLDGIRKKKEQN